MSAKLWYLKKTDLFECLDQEEMQRINEMTRMDEVPKNQPIYFPGQRSDMVYMLKKGRVKISRHTPEGKKLTLALLEPGEIFGELSLTGEGERTTSAETVEKSLICAASKEQFQDILDDHPELALEVTRIIGDRRRKIESRLEQLIFRDASVRMAIILLDMFENHAEESEDGEDPWISFSHQELADLTGLTRPTTTNLLNEFQEKGMIELGRRKIFLKDLPALTRAAESS